MYCHILPTHVLWNRKTRHQTLANHKQGDSASPCSQDGEKNQISASMRNIFYHTYCSYCFLHSYPVFFFLDPDPVTLCSRFPIPSFSFVMCHASHPAALPAEAQPWPRERFLQRTGYFRSPPHPSAPVLFHLLKSPQQFVDDTEFRPPASDYSCAFDCQGSMSVVFRKI